jgi:hypothetical protein
LTVLNTASPRTWLVVVATLVLLAIALQYREVGAAERATGEATDPQVYILVQGSEELAKITAVPAAQADSYLVTGTGFEPGEAIKVIEVTCGELPCAAGGGALVVATPDASGSFSVVLVLNPATVPTDRDYRLIAAFPDSRAGEVTDPQVRVPLHHAAATPTPGAPPSGTGLAGENPTSGPGWPLLAATGAVFVTAGAVLALRRRNA